jgi:methyl-accepting chemotaxis protein
MNFSNMRVRTRLLAGFGVVIVALTIVGAVGVVGMRELAADIDLIVNDRFPKTEQANAIIDDINVVARALRNTLLVADKAEAKKEIDRVAQARERVTKQLAQLDQTIKSPEGRAVLSKVVAARAAYSGGQGEFLKLVQEGKVDEAKVLLLTRVRAEQAAYIDSVEALIKFQGELMAKSGKEAEETVTRVLIQIMAIGGIATALAVAVATLITRSLGRQLGGEPDYAANVAKRIAAGDLVRPVEIRPGDTTSLLAAMKSMQDTLGGIVATIRESTDAVGTASREIAQGNTDLSQRTEEQASSLEETASSMEELTATVKQNADNARQANQLAASASAVAAKGGAVVGEVVATMGAISESSKRIADIISVIDGIAFQTNILALNAAVEAARAGEQGRGFAVVASEVRSLAQRSAAAAKEIKDLITDSTTKVDSGSKLVADAGQTMAEVVSSVKRVTDIMAEITAASLEQSSGIEQVNQAIMQMDQVTQQNAALVEESAAAAESMEEQARQLVGAVAVFKVSGGGALDPAQAAIERARAAAKAKPVSPKPLAVTASPAPKATPKAAPAPAPKLAAKAKAEADDEWAEF